MPILWRYLLRGYFQTFALCVSAFVCVLLVMRLEEIARFAALGAPWGKVLLFAFYQIPYILPIALPVSCLIACSILFQKMSHSHELTALRASGCSMRTIVIPLLFASGSLALFNLVLTCELAPRIRSYSKELVLQITATNPLVLLQKDSLVKLKGSYLDMHASPAPGSAQDVLFITKNASNNRLGLMIAKELSVEDGELRGSDVTFISSLDPKAGDAFDHLIIENQKEMNTAAAGLSQFWDDAHWQMHEDYLPLRTLLAREKVEREEKRAKEAWAPRIGKLHAELARRLSLSLATMTFTIIGFSFGTQIGRNSSKKNLAWSIGLAAAFLLVFIAAKSLKSSSALAVMLYLLPHPLILFLCLRSFNRVNRGVEV